MSTNYNILLRSEKQLKRLIADYLDVVYQMHFKTWKELNEYDQADYGIVFDNAERRIKRAMLREEELIDECIWTISKDGPRANHLRFIISVIYCAKDLTRASEYVASIVKIIVRRNIDQQKLDLIEPIIKSYLTVIEKIIKIYKSNAEEKFEKVDELINQFEQQFDEQERKIREKFKNHTHSGDEIAYLYVSQIVRLINSTIERIKSVFPSTLFIKSSTSTTTISTENKKTDASKKSSTTKKT